MSITSFLLNRIFKSGDIKRDKGLTTPKNIKRYDHLDYHGDQSKNHLLDVYYPNIPEVPLPLIISIHGGGWVYGNKEAYQFYCMNLAECGFAVVNFNYRLAPKHKFPAALEDVNTLLGWVKRNAEAYRFDLSNLFIVGDSAGAQLAAQYAGILTNPDYAGLFNFKTPDIKIKAMALNCGVFDPLNNVKNHGNKLGNKIIKELLKDYLGKDIYKYEKEMDIGSNIVSSYPSVFISCSVNDRLVGYNPVFIENLRDAGIDYLYKEYGQSEKSNAHVFHLDIRNDEAIKLNRELIDFFRQQLK